MVVETCAICITNVMAIENLIRIKVNFCINLMYNKTIKIKLIKIKRFVTVEK